MTPRTILNNPVLTSVKRLSQLQVHSVAGRIVNEKFVSSSMHEGEILN